MEESSLSISCEEIEEPYWIASYEAFVLKVMRFLTVEPCGVAILFCGNAFIRRLNCQFRNKDETTDILSFPYKKDQTVLLGDLVISLSTLKENSLYFGVSEQEELKRVTIHGILHLMGWDHTTNEVTEEMLVYQEEVLEHFQGDVLF